MIKDLARRFFGENLVAVYVFGSTVRGDYRVLSDIDLAVVLKRDVDVETRCKFRALVRDKLGDLHPFEIHIISRDVWSNWYLRFVKKDYVEI